MRRRHMLSIGAGAGFGPWLPKCTYAQPARVKRLGVLTNAPPSSFRQRPFHKMLVDGLLQHGWEQGRNLELVFPDEAVHANGAGLDAAALQLVAAKVDVIFCGHEISASAALRATRTIPIVTFTSAATELGFAKTLARPGGNITGVMTQSYEEHGKVLQLLREIRPGLSRIGFSVGRSLHEWNTWFESFVTAARPTGIEVVPLPGHWGPEYIAPMLEAGTREQVQVLITGPAWWLNTNKTVWAQINEWAVPHKVVTKGSILQRGEVVLAIGANEEIFRQMVAQLDRVLRGANPAELPFIQPTHFDVVINQRLALAVGWPAPRSVLLQATEVIQ